MPLGAPTAVARPNVADVEVALEIMSFRWLSELKASAIPSKLHLLRQRKCAAKPRIQAEEIETMPGIAFDYTPGERFAKRIETSVVREIETRSARSLRTSLLRIGAGDDVVRQTRIVLKDAPKSPAMGNVIRHVVST